MKKNSGITLIALVISIIVMLILAGVSLNMTVGEKGIVTQAQNAKLAQELAQEREEIEMIMADFNISGENTKSALNSFLTRQVNEGKIDSFKSLPLNGKMQIIAEKNGHYYYCVQDGDYWIATSTESSVGDSEDSKGAGFTVVSESNFKEGGSDGSYVLNNNASIVFYDPIDGEFDFDIVAGEVTIYLTNNMKLTNKNKKDAEGNGRSAINIHEGATLNLYIEDGKTVIVDSGLGVDGEVGSEAGAKGGPGGFAGIHVPVGATLNLYGDGTLKAYGGNAGNGTDSAVIYGGGGGGGAGAGIGGNGGNGGNGSTTQTAYNGKLETGFWNDNPNINTNAGFDGGNGESAGTITINDTLNVYAYGGDGGSAGNGISSSGGGGGGYPAAGIGGGGAGGGGGMHCDGAGGYSGGGSEGNSTKGENGLGGGYIEYTDIMNHSVYGCGSGGGGYYSAGKGLSDQRFGTGKIGGMFGGPWAGVDRDCWISDIPGSGGASGAGGTVYYTDAKNIFAYNGNMITSKNFDYSATDVFEYKEDGSKDTSVKLKVATKTMYKEDGTTEEVQFIPCKIFAQSGTIRATYATNQGDFNLSKIKVGTLPTKIKDYWEIQTVVATSEIKNNPTTGYSNPDPNVNLINQGIGSGAGYLEASNGTFQQK